MKWGVQLKTAGSDFELSAIRADNKFGRESWGWDGPTKIILQCEGASLAQIQKIRRAALDFAKALEEEGL